MALVDENYRDNGSLREQDRVRVEDFLSDEDRAQITGRGVPFFSGREAEVGVFRRAVNALSRGRCGNATIVVEGPPGAGKSALMCQFMEEMQSLPPTEIGGRRWLPVPLSASDAESPPNIADAIDEAIVARLAADLLAANAPPVRSKETTGLVEKLSEYWGGDLNLTRAREKAKAFFDRGGRLPYSDLFDLVEEVGCRTSSLSGTNATQFIQDAEQGGLLAPSDDGENYAMPIPSFAGYLLGESLS